MRYVVFNNADTIKIGEVQTVDSSEDARIVDEKNKNKHVLKFFIPRGQSDTIEIGEVTTGLPGSDAKVIDVTGGPNHILDFIIPQGSIGPARPSSTQAIFFTDTVDVKTSGEVTFDNRWLIPGEQESFEVIDNSKVKLEEGIYEIVMSGHIGEVDDTHGGEVYLQDDNGSSIKDLTFKLPAGNDKQIYFSKDIIFRFEVPTILQIIVNITGDVQSSKVVISDVSLLLKKINE